MVDALSQPMKFHIATSSPVSRVPVPAEDVPFHIEGETRTFADIQRKGVSKTAPKTTAELPTMRAPRKFQTVHTRIIEEPTAIATDSFCIAGHNRLAYKTNTVG